jgi:hypothetical protein
MALYDELPVYRDVYCLILKIFEYTRDFPREYKYTPGQDLKRDSMVLVRSIYRANKSKDKREFLETFLDDFELLKLEIRLYAMLEAFMHERYEGPDLPIVPDLVERVVCHGPSAHFVCRGRRSDWKGLPPDKSLFHSREGCGLPIGNLTSQIFVNFYLNGFDHFMKHDFGLRLFFH